MKALNLIALTCLTTLISSCSFENFDERCAREAKEYTDKYCPRRMNDYTTMDSLVFNPHTRTFYYYYCLEGQLDNDSIITAKVANSFIEQLKKELTTSVELRAYKEKDVNFCYVYLSRSTGKTLFETTFTPDDYNPAAPK